jgi:hypothetical protein
VKLEGPHSGENIAEVFINCIQELGVTTKVWEFLFFKLMLKEDKKKKTRFLLLIINCFLCNFLYQNFEMQILAITTDNASNNVTFLRILATKLQQENVNFDADNNHI